MSRLFYESDARTPLNGGRRQVSLDETFQDRRTDGPPLRPPELNAGGANGLPPSEPSRPTAAYLEKVAKLVPSEVIAAYIGAIGLVPLVQSSELKAFAAWFVFAVCLVLTPFCLNFQAVEGKPKRIHLTLSTVSFVVWAYAYSGALLPGLPYDPAAASIVMVLFSAVSGVIPLKS